MSLYRWSLPSKRLNRDKSIEEESSDQSKFTTIHIGQPGPRRKANISSAFATLFEKPENRRGIPNSQDGSAGAGDLPPLAPRRENVLPDANLKYPHGHGSTPIEIGTTPLGRSGKNEPVWKNTDITGTRPPRFLMPGVFSQVTHQINETPKTHSFSLSSTETDVTHQQDEPPVLRPTKSTHELGRIRSTSSSYPSEGMRSPLGGNRSPEPAACTKKFIAEYWQCGAYPSQSSCHLSNMNASAVSAGDTMAMKSQNTIASSGTVSSCTISDQHYDLQLPSSVNALQDCTKPIYSNAAQSRRKSRVFQGIGQRQQPSSNTEMTVPVLENENSVSSQLEVSFMTYKQSNARSTSEGNCQFESSNASSKYFSHPSTDTDGTIMTVARQSSSSDREDAWSTIHDALERPQSRIASWMELFTLPTSSGSTNTLSQRIQKFELRKWVKKVFFRTKVRFELAVRSVPVPEAKPTGSKASPYRRGHMKRKKKIITKKASKTLLKVTKKQAKQQKKTDNHFFGSPTKKKSLQFRFSRLGKHNEHSAHKRVQSCPTTIGL
ncbi:hypothetical protein HD806DRAFT_546585 [Xylariaceae sp. AK1471]|nr:hypothetical protein HD806DRAFT_546585 [Xylariaceae sp. AK1471]